MSTEYFDLCVLGAGTAGYNAAVQARELGHSVALVDGRGDLAGLCILRGCMPAKTVLHAIDVAHEAAVASALGVDAAVHVDAKVLVARKRHLVDEFKEDRLDGIAQFPLFRGEPRFVDAHRLAVDGTTIEAQRFVIATGSTIEAPPITGLTASDYFTSDVALELTRIPKRIVTIGGGPVGCEFAQYFARLGSEVTIVQETPTLLRSEDDDVGQAVRGALERDGVRVMCDARITSIDRRDDERIVSIESQGDRETIVVDAVFLATGRRPNVEDFDFERAGIAFDRTGIRVDEYLRTTSPHIFAAGDVIGRRCLVHAAEHGGKIAAKNAFCDAPVAMDFDLFDTHSVYVQPEVAVTGLTERVARSRNIEIEVASYQFSEHGKALTMNLPDGFVKVVAARADGTILGVTFVGEGAVDLIHEASTLLYYHAKVSDVLNMPHLHPTMGEIITYPCEEISKRLSLQREIVYY